MAERPWYQDFFGQRYLDSYSRVLTPERTLGEVDFIEKTLALPAGSKILDLCYGHGRHLIELASRGYQMTGLDLDPLFLELARLEAQRRRLQVRLEHRDMRDIPFTKEFDATINVFTSFGYLESDEEDQRVLDEIARALKSGGQFLLDTQNRDGLMRMYSRRDWYETETGMKVLESREIDYLAGRNNVRQVTIYPDGTQREASHSLRVYALTELVRMLNSAGLALETTFGGMDGSPVSLESRRLVTVARKP